MPRVEYMLNEQTCLILTNYNIPNELSVVPRINEKIICWHDSYRDKHLIIKDIFYGTKPTNNSFKDDEYIILKCEEYE